MKIQIFVLLCLMITIPVCFSSGLSMTYDLRDVDGHAHIGPVHDQGNCSSCSPFTGMAVYENAFIRGNDRSDAGAIDLSEAFLVWGASPLYDGLNGPRGRAYR